MYSPENINFTSDRIGTKEGIVTYFILKAVK